MTIIYFILILGIVILIHEFGHFIFAKKSGIYVYEFSLGMGPRLFKWTRKNDETEYSIRLLPIGGYVQMAGEELDEDDKNEVPKDKRIQGKPWINRFMVMVAGVMNNFLLALFLLLIIGWFNEVSINSIYLTDIDEEQFDTLVEGDRIVEVDGHFVNNYDKLALELAIHGEKEFEMKVVHKDGSKDTVNVKPKAVYDEDDDEKLKGYDYGFYVDGEHDKGFLAGFKYAFLKFISSIEQMFFTVLYLITGRLSLSMLSGPVGIYTVVGEAAKMGIWSIISLTALISINVGFINILPIPAFDGGHALFLIIEKIIGHPVKPEIENTIHNIFFILLMGIMLYVTFHDIVKLF